MEEIASPSQRWTLARNSLAEFAGSCYLADHVARDWSNAVASTLLTLSGDLDSSRTLQAAFEQIAAEWAQASADCLSLFPSGVTLDGAPVEVSVQTSPMSPTSFRLIAQPHCFCAPSELLLFVRQRALDYIAGRSGPIAAKAVNDLLRFFPDDGGYVFSGNFLLWLGASHSSGDSELCSKLYLNPWATLTDNQGSLIVHHILQQLDAVPVGLPATECMISGPLQAYPHIIGCDFDKHGLRSAKIYFAQSRCPRSILEATDAPWADPDFAVLLAGVPQSAQCGEIHAALTLRRDGFGPEIKVNLFCPDWFHSDESVLAALQNSATFEPLVKRATDLLSGWGDARRFTFVSASSRQTTLYCRVGKAAKK